MPQEKEFEGGLSAFHVAYRPKPVVFEPELGLALIYPQGEFCQAGERLGGAVCVCFFVVLGFGWILFNQNKMAVFKKSKDFFGFGLWFWFMKRVCCNKKHLLFWMTLGGLGIGLNVLCYFLKHLLFWFWFLVFCEEKSRAMIFFLKKKFKKKETVFAWFCFGL